MRALTAGILGLFCLTILAGCTRSGDRRENEPRLPGDLMIVFGEGGGITGLWQGYSIQPDGAVLRWEGHAAEQDPQRVGTLDDATRAALWAEIQAHGLLEGQAGEQGDLTRFIRLTAEDQTHKVAWVPGRRAGGGRGSWESLYRLLTETATGKSSPHATPGETGD